MIVETATGSSYVIDNEALTVTRERSTHELRRDNEPLRLFGPVEVHLGQPMVMVLEPLDPAADTTLRITSPVTCIVGREQ